MKKLSEQNNLLKPPKIGELVEGKIISKGKSSLFLDLGPIGTGIIYGREFQGVKDTLKKLKIGDNIFAKIIELENEEGYVELSISEAGKDLTWESLKQKKEKREQIKVKILGANKGGLLTEISGIPAFLPVSQLSPEHYPRLQPAHHPPVKREIDTQKILRELQKFIGKELEVQIFDLDPKTGKLILSEKAEQSEKIKEILKNYKVGDIVEGQITGLVDFGAFIKFGPENLEGLIHISELDWQLIEDPSEIVKVGQKVKAEITEISDAKVSLSLKALKKDPWKDIAKIYKKGDIVKGKIIRLNPFGAFVQITPSGPAAPEAFKGRRLKIQGLCHISEFGSRTKMEDVLRVNKKYDFQILFIDPKEHRINLKLSPTTLKGY